MSKWAVLGHHGHEVTDRQLMGGVMKLGKALATGVAEERQRPRTEERAPGRPARTEAEARTEIREAPRATATEEVPAAR
ncbi:hypothetical protein ACF061_30815 [Streptomyces sp. NPDC015220]|uniref:hypothetical protein n=1 Tax=Streptomyces sp. NPDC015220 TaxID=3364947 RepID=UPI0036FB12E2